MHAPSSHRSSCIECLTLHCGHTCANMAHPACSLSASAFTDLQTKNERTTLSDQVAKASATTRARKRQARIHRAITPRIDAVHRALDCRLESFAARAAQNCQANESRLARAIAWSDCCDSICARCVHAVFLLSRLLLLCSLLFVS